VSDATVSVHWDGRKWPDRLHWQFEMLRLGEDAHGSWLYVPAGSAVKRGDEPERRLANGFVSLVPPDSWWEAEFYWDHPVQLVYVNIGTPCELSAGGIRQVDLDLDVIRTIDGRVETLDEDEFAHHQVLYQYPTDLIAAARRSADEVARMLAEHAEPFGHAAERWINQARNAG
jgi:hypothetical protein